MGKPIQLQGTVLLVAICLSVLFAMVPALPGRKCDPVILKQGLHVYNCTGRDRIKINDNELPDDAEVIDFSRNRFMELPFLPESASCPENTDCKIFSTSDHCRLHISFSRNEISRFHENALHGLRCLRTLDLSFNELTKEIFSSHIFQEGVYRLQTLILRGNPLGSFPDNILVEPFMPELRHLDLSQCQLDEIEENSVDDFPDLQNLNLSFNNLKTLGYRTFKGLNNLKVLDLRHNKLTHLPKLVFADLVNLHLLQLSNNLVQTFHKDSFTNDSNLQNLELYNNKLLSIPYEAVDKLPKLRMLDLSCNPIVRVNRGEAVNSVKTLYLNHLHQLKSLDKDALASFPSLVNLSISWNPQLETIHPLMLADNSSALMNLYLEGNKLSTLPASAVPFKQLKALKLSGNPWMCDERIAWMIKAPSIKPNTAKCAEPLRLRDVYIKTLSPLSLQRYVSVRPIVAIITFCLLLPFVVGFGYLIWKRRHHCACTSVSIKGRYVTVFTRDMDGEDEGRMSVDLKFIAHRLTGVSNGDADDSIPFVNVEEPSPKDEDDDDEDI